MVKFVEKCLKLLKCSDDFEIIYGLEPSGRASVSLTFVRFINYEISFECSSGPANFPFHGSPQVSSLLFAQVLLRVWLNL